MLVEWEFRKVIQFFAFLGFKYGLKTGLSPIATWYFTGVFLTNCHTCYYGSNNATAFGCTPPCIEEYLSREEREF
ncbi:hypothetical protein L873DRAFT_1697127 [Choiromyces venosus 120613-1]|uniref:Uncharacterized protein n=1 Tax=Choiromyces venosus 120613-1 TaxID=1336337 RepID=A0A3N4JBJ8_9PEZI|nr:hypothetical protein L873DRAFT_1697127 [Choiromyces venosus 120613-1]